MSSASRSQFRSAKVVRLAKQDCSEACVLYSSQPASPQIQIRAISHCTLITVLTYMHIMKRESAKVSL